jgi:hypothetical protein
MTRVRAPAVAFLVGWPRAFALGTTYFFFEKAEPIPVVLALPKNDASFLTSARIFAIARFKRTKNCPDALSAARVFSYPPAVFSTLSPPEKVRIRSFSPEKWAKSHKRL